MVVGITVVWLVAAIAIIAVPDNRPVEIVQVEETAVYDGVSYTSNKN